MMLEIIEMSSNVFKYKCFLKCFNKQLTNKNVTGIRQHEFICHLIINFLKRQVYMKL